jgi:uncharacterized protein YggE
MVAAGLLLLLPQTAPAQNNLGPKLATAQTATAEGEVLAQVSARGTVRSKPDLATFRVTVIGQAVTYAAARTAADTIATNLTSKLVSLGLTRAAVRALPNGGAGRMGFIGNEAYGDEDSAAAASAAMSSALQRRGATTVLEVQVADMAKLGPVRALLEQQEGTTTGAPVLSLRDESAARRAAIASGVAKAREDADAYAAALGMRFVRIARVYDQTAPAGQTQDFAQMISLMNSGRDDQVVTEVRVGMDVVLAPR